MDTTARTMTIGIKIAAMVVKLKPFPVLLELVGKAGAVNEFLFVVLVRVVLRVEDRVPVPVPVMVLKTRVDDPLEPLVADIASVPQVTV